MTDAVEIIESEESEVACEGNGPALGHPKVYLDLSRQGYVNCPYCSRRFVYKNAHHSGSVAH